MLSLTIPFFSFTRYIFLSIQTICRRTRKTLTTVELRRSARKPWRHLNPLYYAALAKTLQALPQVQQLQSPLQSLQQLQQQTSISASLAATVPPVAVVAPLLSGSTPSTGVGEKSGVAPGLPAATPSFLATATNLTSPEITTGNLPAKTLPGGPTLPSGRLGNSGSGGGSGGASVAPISPGKNTGDLQVVILD